VHSDLSPFNILAYRSQAWFIDLAAGIRVDRLGWPPWVRLSEALRALEKGLGSLQRYFRRYGLEFDPRDLMGRVQVQIDKFGVL
jgi:serine/threonine-protein kinase RIO1